jgi:hypothetical protein
MRDRGFEKAGRTEGFNFLIRAENPCGTGSPGTSLRDLTAVQECP